MACKVVGKLCKLVGDRLPIQIDLTDFCERRWDRKRAAGIYAITERVRPTPAKRTGYEYEATTPGQVGVEEPAWPVVVGETVLDGSVVWTCRAIGNGSLFKTIVSADWDGDGFTVEDEELTNTAGRQLVAAFISGELANGKYLPLTEVTFSDGHVESFGVEVKV